MKNEIYYSTSNERNNHCQAKEAYHEETITEDMIEQACIHIYQKIIINNL